ncbi:MAG: response regulator [Gemmatimonadales bacterium]
MTPRILVIEDDADTGRLLCARLRSAGFEPQLAGDAVTGLHAARRTVPDLVILDLAMPAGGGLAVLRSLRLSSKTNLVPVIVLTGTPDENRRNEAMEAGANALIGKPYDAAPLLDEIRKQLGCPT